ncbi:MAG: iron-containing redox enzyme family protein [Psychrosphaera sp.]|nr:iron-containing redox enzyme family protein [Psychrosphaera sp.]
MTAVQPVTNCHKVLRSLIDMLIPGTSQKASQILNKDLTRETYIDYLIDLYHMVVAVVPQMQAAIDTLKKEDNPDNLPFIDYLEHHLEEEAGHDLWILDDLKNLGVARETVFAKTPKQETLNMVGALYYRIIHMDPTAILGYMAVGETYPISNSILDTMKKAANLDENQVYALRQHALIDVDHSAEFYEFISSVKWTAKQQQHMLDSARSTIYHMIIIGDTFG